MNGQGRHADLFEAEYAKQLERIDAIRASITLELPQEARPVGTVEILPPAPAWDAAPPDYSPAPPSTELVLLREVVPSTSTELVPYVPPRSPRRWLWLWLPLALLALVAVLVVAAIVTGVHP